MSTPNLSTNDDHCNSQNMEEEIKSFLVEVLALEDITPEEIGSEDPLFDGELSLDSVDALEIGIALQKKYGVKIDPRDEKTREQFATVKSLAHFVLENR